MTRSPSSRPIADTVDVHARASRAALAQLVMQLFTHWDIGSSEQAALLGLSSDSRSALARYRKGAPFADNKDLLSRAGHLLGIHKSLRIVFPHNRSLVYRWVSTPNQNFGGRTPLDFMAQSYEGLLAVRRYLDFERGR
jgi:hypothetical protein